MKKFFQKKKNLSNTRKKIWDPTSGRKKIGDGRNIWEHKKKKSGERRTKKIHSKTYILYGENGMIKLTFVSKLDQAMNTFGEFTIFSPNDKEKSNSFVKNNKKISPA